MKPQTLLAATVTLFIIVAVAFPQPLSPIVLPDQPTEQVTEQPAEIALQLEVDCPPEIAEHELHELAVATNAAHTRVRVRRGLFDTVRVRQLHSASQGISEYGWTGPPGEYLVEVDVFDQEYGIGGDLIKVTVVETDPPKPPPNDEPGPPNGDSLSELAANWLLSVPENQRPDAGKAAQVMQDFAAGHEKYKTFEDMQAAFSLSLGNVLTNVQAWGTFGDSMEAEAEKRNVNTPEAFAEFLWQVAKGIE